MRYARRPVKPKSRSCIWSGSGEGLAQVDALMVCLRWVWMVHESHCGEKCPWELGDPYDWEVLE